VKASPDHPILVDRFSPTPRGGRRPICDGERVVIGGIMEHIEQAGVHSGDSACSIPPYSLSKPVIEEILDSTRRIALELGVRGTDERAVCGEGRAPLRDRGEPARVAHGAIRVEAIDGRSRSSRRW